MSKASGRVGARAGKAAKFGGEGGGGGGAGGAGAGKAGAGKAGSSAGGATASRTSLTTGALAKAGINADERTVAQAWRSTFGSELVRPQQIYDLVGLPRSLVGHGNISETYQKLGIKRVTLDPDSDIKFVLPEKKTASTMSTRKLKRELG